MEQEPTLFRATIVDPKDDEPPSAPPPLPPPQLPTFEPIPEEKAVEPEICMPEPELKPSCCMPEPEHDFERLERHSELADALPSIFIGIGVAYVIGVLTGAAIFSSPSMIIEA